MSNQEQNTSLIASISKMLATVQKQDEIKKTRQQREQELRQELDILHEEYKRFKELLIKLNEQQKSLEKLLLQLYNTLEKNKQPIYVKMNEINRTSNVNKSSE